MRGNATSSDLKGRVAGSSPAGRANTRVVGRQGNRKTDIDGGDMGDIVRTPPWPDAAGA